MNTLEIERWAAVLNAARPDWPEPSLRRFATNSLAHRTYRDALVAGVWVAADPATRNPGRIVEPGPWWQATAADDRTAPRIEVERCPHGVKTYAPCVECRPPSDPEVRRAAIEQAKRKIRESLPITEGAEQ
ncbi:MAG: hypothetical protein IPM11_00705 [Micropruina sp.]|nr:hypothetical protein [Micropruina sp.]